MAAKKPAPSTKPVSKRLSWKPGVTWFAPNVPPEVKPLLAGIELRARAPKTLGAALVFVRNKAELAKLWAKVAPRIDGDPLLWICYPKGGSGVETDLNRDVAWHLLWEKGVRPVSQIALDETWSALRFRPQALVKSRPGEGPTTKDHPPVRTIRP